MMNCVRHSLSGFASKRMAFTCQYGIKVQSFKTRNELFMRTYSSPTYLLGFQYYVSRSMKFLKRLWDETHKSKEISRSAIYKVKEEAKGGTEFDSLLPRMKRQDVEEEPTFIKEGDIVNLQDLLFTEKRDYLIKSDGQEVKVEQLVGKVIIILYFKNSTSMFEWEWSIYLKGVYNDLLPTNNFEVIVVASDIAEEIFERRFSEMPWTAIPFSDITSRKRIARRFGVSWINESSSYSIPFVIDPKGVVLNCDPTLKFGESRSQSLFCTYGALGYPYSYERIKFLDAEDEEIAMKPSLETLLGSPIRDYVISNNGDKVPIHTLKDKVVVLYFFEYTGFEVEVTRQLKVVYNELVKNKEKFEVVLLYITNTSYTLTFPNEESFWKTFKTMPWLALPYKDPNLLKLVRIFDFPDKVYGSDGYPELVIFGPNGEFIDPYGTEVLENFGISAYPFTREKVFKLEFEKINGLKLEMLWDSNSVSGVKDGLENFSLIGKLIDSCSDIRLSQLGGKRLIIFFEINWPYEYPCNWKYINKLKVLKKRYLEMKGTDDEFEVIHLKESSSSSNNEHVGELPWLVHYYGESHYSLPKDLVHHVLGFSYYCGGYQLSDSSLFAFDRDGRLVRKTIYPTFKSNDFPFYAGGLEKELFYDLDHKFGWFWSYFLPSPEPRVHWYSTALIYERTEKKLANLLPKS